MVHPRQRDGLAVIASPVGTFSAAFYLAKTISSFRMCCVTQTSGRLRFTLYLGLPPYPSRHLT